MQYSIKELKLKRGSRGLLIDVPGSPEMWFNFNFRAGYFYVDDYLNKQQVAHLMEHLSAGATVKHPDMKAWNRLVAQNGAYANAHTSDINLQYEMACADYEWRRILDLMAEEICRPLFNEERLKSEFGNVRSELTKNLSISGRVLFGLDRQMGSRHLTYPEMIATLDNITLNDLTSHHKRTHTHKNMRFVIAGDLADKENEIADVIDSMDLPDGERINYIENNDIHSTRAFLSERDKTPGISLRIRISQKREMTRQERLAMNILNMVLTGRGGQISSETRRQGLMYWVNSRCYTDESISSWIFTGQSNVENLLKSAKVVMDELVRVKNGDINEGDLEDAKSMHRGILYRNLQTELQIAGRIMPQYFYNGTIEDPREDDELIKSITSEQVIELAREFMRANIWGVGLYGTTTREIADKVHDRLGNIFGNG